MLSLHLAACTTKYTTRIVVTLALKHHYAKSFWRQLSLSDTCSKTYVHFYPSMPRPDRYPSMPGPDRYPLVCPDSNVLVTPGIRPYARCQAAMSAYKHFLAERSQALPTGPTGGHLAGSLELPRLGRTTVPRLRSGRAGQRLPLQPPPHLRCNYILTPLSLPSSYRHLTLEHSASPPKGGPERC